VGGGGGEREQATGGGGRLEAGLGDGQEEGRGGGARAEAGSQEQPGSRLWGPEVIRKQAREEEEAPVYSAAGGPPRPRGCS